MIPETTAVRWRRDAAICCTFFQVMPASFYDLERLLAHLEFIDGRELDDLGEMIASAAVALSVARQLLATAKNS